MQIMCTSLQTDNHASTGSTSSVKFLQPNALLRVHTLTFKKIPGLSRIPRTFLQDAVAAQQYSNVKTNELLTQNIQYGSTIHGRIAEHSSQVDKKVLGLPLSHIFQYSLSPCFSKQEPKLSTMPIVYFEPQVNFRTLQDLKL